jgi:hypothetical protein
MQIDKQQILDLMQTRGEPGDPDRTDQARDELPQQIDTDNPEHQNLLQRLGIDPQDIVAKLAGGSFGL